MIFNLQSPSTLDCTVMDWFNNNDIWILLRRTVKNIHIPTSNFWSKAREQFTVHQNRVVQGPNPQHHALFCKQRQANARFLRKNVHFRTFEDILVNK